jgi:protein TonB
MRFSTAIAASVAVHLLLAAAAWAYFAYFSRDTVLAQLDLSSVEISFAEDEAEDSPVVPVPPSAPPEPPSPSEPDPPPAAPQDEPPLPPDADAPSLPEPPPEEAAKLDAPERAKERPQPKAEEPVPEKQEMEEAKKAAADSAAAPQAAPRQAKVDAPPRPKKAIRPDYPRESRSRGEEGDVVLEISVDERGFVYDVKVVEPCKFRDLNDAAVKAARSARFTPARSGNLDVRSKARLTLTFRLK